MWVHIAGAARGCIQRAICDAVATATVPGRRSFRSPTSSRSTSMARARPAVVAIAPDQRPKMFYTNTPVEYWGGGRAAALTHTSGRWQARSRAAGQRPDVSVGGHAAHRRGVSTGPHATGVRRGAAAAQRSGGQQLNNPTPHDQRHAGAASSVAPVGSRRHAAAAKPISAHQRQDARSRIQDVKCSLRCRGVADPRRISDRRDGSAGRSMPLPHLVPQVDARWKRPRRYPRS